MEIIKERQSNYCKLVNKIIVITGWLCAISYSLALVESISGKNRTVLEGKILIGFLFALVIIANFIYFMNRTNIMVRYFVFVALFGTWAYMHSTSKSAVLFAGLVPVVFIYSLLGN